MEDKQLKTLNIGWIPSFLGLEPLRVELINYLRDSVNIYPGTPMQISKLLQDGSIDIAPVASVNLLQNYQMSFPAGLVCSDYSVGAYIGFASEGLSYVEKMKERISFLRVICQGLNIEQVSEFKKTASSILESSDQLLPLKPELPPLLKLQGNCCESVVALAKLFYRLMFGKVAFDSWMSQSAVEDKKFDMVLLSGKEALLRRKEFIRVIDLGHFWYSLTDLPFVPAVWQVKNLGAVSPLWKKKIIDVCELTQSKMHIDSSNYVPTSLDLLNGSLESEFATYCKGLRYKFDSKDIKGLMLFLALVRPFIKSSIDEVAITKMLILKDSTVDTTL